MNYQQQCPNCNAEPKQIRKQYCQLAGTDATTAAQLKSCINPSALQEALVSDCAYPHPCDECIHDSMFELVNTLSEINMKKPPTVTSAPLFEQTHICWQCGTKYSFIS